MPQIDDLPVQIPDPETIRAAIASVDERARLLRRLLRLTLRLHEATPAQLLTTPARHETAPRK